MTDAWTNFFVGQLGASAALLGLIFVGVSINLTKILGSRDLADRALLAMVLLLVILVVSSLLLIPGQPLTWLGVEVLILGVRAWIVGMVVEIGTLRHSDQSRTVLFSNLILLHAATIPFLVAGGALVSAEANGLNWLAASFVISLIKAVVDAWVLLVEVNR